MIFGFEDRWICPDCGDPNTESRQVCYRCGTERIKAKVVVPGPAYFDSYYYGSRATESSPGADRDTGLLENLVPKIDNAPSSPDPMPESSDFTEL